MRCGKQTNTDIRRRSARDQNKKGERKGRLKWETVPLLWYPKVCYWRPSRVVVTLLEGGRRQTGHTTGDNRAFSSRSYSKKPSGIQLGTASLKPISLPQEVVEKQRSSWLANGVRGSTDSLRYHHLILRPSRKFFAIKGGNNFSSKASGGRGFLVYSSCIKRAMMRPRASQTLDEPHLWLSY
ncbi:hypothetical protein BJ508DRAFT_378250 [Ascobolus immersus RN42]|uniref:Uncharacterized protein n=1 Tax=Ascobolus immersus RN42 TaxID=1160509 RepID=A0A3N4HZT5_ASCIM|nr:hypothetical protein BJ508DRAFT_378250 [Ascobolus immersus RN42]